MGITCSIQDMNDLESIEREFTENGADMFFSESPTNPYLRCVDIPKIKEVFISKQNCNHYVLVSPASPYLYLQCCFF